MLMQPGATVLPRTCSGFAPSSAGPCLLGARGAELLADEAPLGIAERRRYRVLGVFVLTAAPTGRADPQRQLPRGTLVGAEPRPLPGIRTVPLPVGLLVPTSCLGWARIAVSCQSHPFSSEAS
jgi:hypothetical protein